MCQFHTFLRRPRRRPVRAATSLGPDYDWFTEAFDAPVLTGARSLLDELV
jgi:hypothetical protein